MKKFLVALHIALIVMLLIALPVLAYSYSTDIEVQETNGTSYAPMAITADIDNEELADANFIKDTALDTRILWGSTEMPWMVAEDRVNFFTYATYGDSTDHFSYTFGNSDASYMPVVIGYDGYITVSDDADLELGDDFEIEFEGYIDTSSGSNKNLVYKEEAFVLRVGGTEKVGAGLFETYYPDEDAETSSVDGYAYFQDLNGQAWATAVADVGDNADDDNEKEDANALPVGWRCDAVEDKYDQLSRAIFLFDTSGIPDDAAIVSATLYIYGSATANDGAWDNTTLNIYSSDPAADTAVAAGDYDSLGSTAFCDTGITIGDWSTVDFNAFAFNESGLAAVSVDGATKLGARTNYDVNGIDPGWTLGTDSLHFGCYFADEAGTDKDPKLVVVYGVQADGISSGEHIIKTYADGTDLGIIVDEGEAGEVSDTMTLGALSVPDNANDIIINQNNVLPYFDYYKHTVSDTLIAWYQPVTMISGTTLPDRQGAAENGTITWGSNPAGVDVTIGSAIPSGQLAPSTSQETDPEDIIAPGGNIDTSSYDVPTDGTVARSVYDMLDTWIDAFSFDVPVMVFLNVVWVVISLGLMIWLAIKIPDHRLIAFIAGGAMLGIGVGLSFLPWWVMAVYVPLGIGLLAMERKPVL